MIINCKSIDQPYINADDSFNNYVADIRKYRQLERKEEIELLIAAQQTEDMERRANAIKTLVCHNQRFVISVAKKYASSANLLDLINEGNIGLMEAIQHFDTTRTRIHFVTYAVWWIRKEINKYVYDDDILVHPNNNPKIMMYSSAVRREYIAKHQCEPQPDELKELIKEKYKFNVPEVSDLYDCIKVTIDNGNDNNDDNPNYGLHRFDILTASNNTDDQYEREHSKTVVEQLLQCLHPEHREIVMMFFGLGEYDEMTLSGISFRVGLTEERVRQIIAKSVEKMRNKTIFKTKIKNRKRKKYESTVDINP